MRLALPRRSVRWLGCALALPLLAPGSAPGAQQAAWGVTVEGVRCRVVPDRGVWRLGESPTFRVELENVGGRTLSIHTWRRSKRLEPRVKLTVDGGWGELLRVEPPVESTAFRPGTRLREIRFSTADYGIDHDRSINTLKLRRDLRPIRLQPGKHTVQVRFDLQWPGNGGTLGTDVASAPVEIQVVPAP